MQFARLDDLVVHYQWARSGNHRPAIVFVNSLGCDLRTWQDVAAPLSDQFDVLSYDMRGHGLTDVGHLTCDLGRLGADLAALMDHLQVGSAMICGVSLGGMVAQQLYALRPDLVGSLVLSDTLPRIGDEAFWTDRVAAIRAGGMPAIADRVIERWFSASYRRNNPAAYAGYRTMLMRQPADGYVAACEALAIADLTAQAVRIAVPTLCVAGDQDASTPPDEVSTFARNIPGARFERIADCGHLPSIERPQAFVQLLRVFATTSTMETISHVSD